MLVKSTAKLLGVAAVAAVAVKALAAVVRVAKVAPAKVAQPRLRSNVRIKRHRNVVANASTNGPLRLPQKLLAIVEAQPALALRHRAIAKAPRLAAQLATPAVDAPGNRAVAPATSWQLPGYCPETAPPDVVMEVWSLVGHTSIPTGV